MIIYRHRFSGFVAMPASTADERARHLDLCRRAMQCALTIIADHVHIVSTYPAHFMISAGLPADNFFRVNEE